jgi:putative ABC transport system permease protein
MSGAAQQIASTGGSTGWISLRLLLRMRLREQPLRLLVTVLAIAMGVALGAAVYLINASALAEFDRATRRVIGDADLIVRGPASGFNERLFVMLARDPAVAEASPVLQLQVALPAPRSAAPSGSAARSRSANRKPAGPLGDEPLPILGLDPFRAAALQPQLVGALAADVTRLLAHDAVVLSDAAAEELQLHRGDALPVIVGSGTRILRVIDVLPTDAYPDALGVMDIASAQWMLGRLGLLDRIDLRLRPGVDLDAFRARLLPRLPPGVIATTPRIENGRAATATRAYRVNLNMLALVALLTGAFLVFATQSLSVLRRRVPLGLLRALGVTRAELRRALLGEGALIGLTGSLLGILLGAALATLVLAWLGADLGNRQLAAIRATFGLHPLAMLVFTLIGVLCAGLGAWLPAYEAARRAPAAALKAGDAEPLIARLPATTPGLILLAAGAVLAWLPPVHGLPLAGYGSVGCLLLGAVLLVPRVTRSVMQALPSTGRVVVDASVAQLRGSAGSTIVSLAAVIVSFSLMVAMAIMVHSFRDSFELWLVKLLPADVSLRAAPGSDSVRLSAAEQRRIGALPQVARAEFERVQQLYLAADEPAVTLIARDISPTSAADVLPLLGAAHPVPPGAQAAWISESLHDRRAGEPGGWIRVPLGARAQRFFVAGVWRDYVHPGGAIVISRADYISATGDRTATQGQIWRRPAADAAGLDAAVRSQLRSPGALQVLSDSQLRERSLRAFDRAFLVTYALEAVAVLIGLVGISMSASATALARRGQFGMLRHLGLLRRQVLGMLACEGVLTSVLAVACGLTLGALLSLVLVYVINRESFHWSIDLSVPWGELAVLSATLIGAAAITALCSGRAALGQDAVRAVREDW